MDMKRTIYTLGETVYDILFSEGRPVAATPGGAMLNTSVSLGRLGAPVTFISEYGTDIVGNKINAFLLQNGVDISKVYRYSDVHSSLALAFLDTRKDAEYEFYKVNPSDRLDITLPALQAGDMVAFGSFYGISPDIYPRILSLVQQARENGALIYYDPNFRKPHLPQLEQLRPMLMQNFALADVVRTSDDDMQLIFGVSTPQEAWNILRPLCRVMIYTSSNKAAWWYSAREVVESTPPVITPVSTVGAGDTFNAGLLYGLFKKNVHAGDLEFLSVSKISDLMDVAMCCASEVCQVYENYISESFANAMR